MEELLLSVIVPIYKVEQYLDRCVQSILNQGFDRMEIILVDDGSPDRCGRMCDEYACQYDMIKVIHKENGGLSDARNAGIRIAKGKYIACIDSDDYIKPGMFSNLCKVLEENDADIAICGFDMVFQDGVVNRYAYKEEVLPAVEAICKMIFDRTISFSAWNKIYKRSLFMNMEYPVGLLYEDYYLTPRLLMESSVVVVTDEVFYEYCIRNDSIMGESNRKISKDIVTVSRANYDYFRENKKQMQSEQYRMIIAGIVNHLYECSRQVFLSNCIEEYKDYISAYRKCLLHMIVHIIANKKINIRMKQKILLSMVSPKLYSRAMQNR